MHARGGRDAARARRARGARERGAPLRTRYHEPMLAIARCETDPLAAHWWSTRNKAKEKENIHARKSSIEGKLVSYDRCSFESVRRLHIERRPDVPRRRPRRPAVCSRPGRACSSECTNRLTVIQRAVR
ncbi:jg16235 [Pararge aegeria aegeria]|uniref:Jg16235 protein n=1 Tax=Pararge aegeria aegeria TaxID=348720 RepID=A0A8S4RWE2_9NEOP|nr:jg16235 [Pararge aegeria aegeria]